MKIFSNKENLNNIILTHNGTKMKFQGFTKPFPYYGEHYVLEEPEKAEFIFEDLQEIDNLISMLEKFRKECRDYIGTWR